MICLSTTHRTMDAAVAAVQRNQRWINLVELRGDYLSPEDLKNAGEFPAMLRRALGRSIPVILTIRRLRDGGQCTMGDAERLELVDALSTDAGFAYLDLEEDLLESDSARRVTRDFPGRVIRSFHGVDGTPDDLESLYRRLSSVPGEIPKMALRVPGSRELRRVVELMLSTIGEDRIILGMGEYGFPSRILAARYGCLLTYTSDMDVTGTEEAAPGHLSPRALTEVYHYRDIDGDTRLFGIIGDPVLHSRSPAYHNAAFREAGLDALYVPFPTDDVDEFLRLADLIRIEGVSVTIPHKEAVRAHLTAEDPAVAGAGACNTIVRSETGWQGTNTDVPGFLEPLVEVWSEERRAATVIGAGGAARGVVYALRSRGVHVLVLNRTPERARRLIAELGHGGDHARRLVASGIDAEGIDRASDFRDIVVQTTNVGMTPNVDQEPIPDFPFHGTEIVYDLVYTPEQTRFLRRAAAAGCTTISGIAMFRRQAELQHELFRKRLTGDQETS